MIYTCNTLPCAWIIDHGGLWIVPAIPNGWHKRTKYRGHLSALVATPDYNKIGLGVP